MEFVVKYHAYKRQKRRKITDADIAAAIGNILITYSGSDDTTVIVGRVGDRELKVYIEGSWPQNGRLVVNTVAWKGEEDD